MSHSSDTQTIPDKNDQKNALSIRFSCAELKLNDCRPPSNKLNKEVNEGLNCAKAEEAKEKGVKTSERHGGRRVYG